MPEQAAVRTNYDILPIIICSLILANDFNATKCHPDPKLKVQVNHVLDRPPIGFGLFLWKLSVISECIELMGHEEKKNLVKSLRDLSKHFIGVECRRCTAW